MDLCFLSNFIIKESGTAVLNDFLFLSKFQRHENVLLYLYHYLLMLIDIYYLYVLVKMKRISINK